jgi:hypothetical protein
MNRHIGISGAKNKCVGQCWGMSQTPGYVDLVSLLPTHRNLMDGCDEVTLAAEDTAQIWLLDLRRELTPQIIIGCGDSSWDAESKPA